MRRSSRLLIALSCAVLTLAVGAPSQAAAARGAGNEPGQIAAERAKSLVDTGWKRVDVDSRWRNLTTVTTKQPLLLTVTDAYCKGDVIAIRDNGELLGTTSDVPKRRCADSDIRKPWLALASDEYSNGAFLLKPGRTHHLEIRLAVNPFGGAGVPIRLDTPGSVWGTIHRTLAKQ